MQPCGPFRHVDLFLLLWKMVFYYFFACLSLFHFFRFLVLKFYLMDIGLLYLLLFCHVILLFIPSAYPISEAPLHLPRPLKLQMSILTLDHTNQCPLKLNNGFKIE